MVTGGHSLENYYFDFRTMSRALENCAFTESYSNAMSLYESLFESALRVAACLSVVGHHFGYPTRLRKTINWQMLEINGEAMCLDVSKWSNGLRHNQDFSKAESDSIISWYEDWKPKIDTLDRGLIRWLSHGHLGLVTLWGAYARCVFDISKDRSEADRVNSPSDALKFNACFASWVNRALDRSADSPLLVLEMLGVQEPPVGG